MAFSLGEYQDIFLEEADDQIQELNRNLLEMEQNPDDENIINNIFRAAHSLKSSAAFVGLNDLSELAHKMENLLQGVRDRTFRINQEIIDVLFKSFDYINTVIETVSQGEEPRTDLKGVIADVTAVHERAKKGGDAPAPSAREEKTTDTTAEAARKPKTSFSPQEKKLLKKGLDEGMDCYEVSVFLDADAQMKWVKAQLIVNNVKSLGQILKTLPDEDKITDESVSEVFKIIVLTAEDIDAVFRACDVDQVNRVDVVKISLTQRDDKYVLTYQNKGSLSDREADIQPAPQVIPKVESAQSVIRRPATEPAREEDAVPEEADRSGDRKKRGTTLRTVKVSVDKLDELLNNVGELVIANSGFFRLYEELKKQNTDKTLINEFKNRMEQMSRIAKDLQSGIMKTRMVPIGQVFDRFNRLVRDLARDCNKNVQLVTKGEDTELDKKVIDVIGEPLMHMIRNSIDHGIESYEERTSMKKSEVATVTLNAYQGGNQIYVEVIDDGRGLNIDLIKRKAIERGLATPEMIANMDPADIYDFIFQPGFSTANKITDVSGRGVGMNVVKEVVSEMNGSVTIESELGMGTRFIMSFPLTLAIIPAIMVTVRDETYAIPLSDVIETIKIAEEDITTIEGHEVINLRGEILSLLRLNEFVGIESSLTDMENIPVVVVGYNNRKIGLIVDELEGKMEIVIKSLDQNYMNVEGLAGASILGDGSICLILDISSMISRVISEQEKISKEEKRVILQKKEAAVEAVAQKELSDVARDALPPKRDAKSSYISLQDLEEDHTDDVTSSPMQRSLTRDTDKTATAVSPAASAPVTPSDIYADQTSPVIAAKNEVPEEKVKEALEEFRSELTRNVTEVLGAGESDEHIKKSLNISADDMKKVQLLANVGIMQGAESLSMMIGKRVDIAIPEVRMMPIETIPSSIGKVDDVYVGVHMTLDGDLKGTVLLSMPDEASYTLVDDLYGFDTGKTRELNDDASSALREITNIVGSSVVNAISEKTGLDILPSVPVIVHDFMQAILDSILVMHNMKNDYALIMDTVFYYEDDRTMANLLIVPDADSLKNLVSNLRNE